MFHLQQLRKSIDSHVYSLANINKLKFVEFVIENTKDFDLLMDSWCWFLCFTLIEFAKILSSVNKIKQHSSFYWFNFTECRQYSELNKAGSSSWWYYAYLFILVAQTFFADRCNLFVQFIFCFLDFSAYQVSLLYDNGYDFWPRVA